MKIYFLNGLPAYFEGDEKLFDEILGRKTDSKAEFTSSDFDSMTNILHEKMNCIIDKVKIELLKLSELDRIVRRTDSICLIKVGSIAILSYGGESFYKVDKSGGLENVKNIKDIVKSLEGELSLCMFKSEMIRKTISMIEGKEEKRKTEVKRLSGGRHGYSKIFGR